LLAFAGILGAGALAQSPSLIVERRGDYLYVAAPQTHFLEGRALEKLHNGSTITYVITLTAASKHGRTPAFSLKGRFVVSFDLWEEKYSVVQAGEDRTVSRLTAAGAEAWCLENMPIPLRAVPAQQPFMVRLECLVDESDDDNGKNGSRLTLAGIIDIFSRKGAEKPLRWEAAAGPLRLSDLKSKQVR
jgi:hypothetical protein